MFGQSLLSAFGSAACTTNTDQLFGTDVQTTSVATYQLNNATTSIPSNTYPGTPSNITYATGKFGNAAVFNGSNSKIQIDGLSTFLGSSSSKSLSCWIKTTSTSGGNRAIISDYNTGVGNYNFDCFMTPGDGKVYLVSNAGGTGGYILSSATINNGVWHHICAVQNTTTNTLELYIDSNSQGTISIGTGTRTSPLFIGTYGAGYYWDGSIDQVRIFDSALPQSAITALYNETTTTATSASIDYVDANPNSVAYYKMSDATDQLGNYNGTATNVNFNTEGKFGFAGAFNGSSSYITMNNTVSTSLTFTASLWVNGVDMNRNSSDPNQIQTIFYNRNPYIVISQYGGNWQYTIKNSSSQNTTINYATSNFNDNEWYNIVISCDGVGGQMNYYVNGQSVGTNTAPTSTINVASTGFVGSGGIGQYFNGKIDQIRIYDSALSAANVTTLYNEIECPAVAVTNAFNTVLYTGNDTNTSYTRNVTGVGFKPDFIWIKSRDTSGFEHALFDSVRGAGASKILSSNTTGVEGWTSAGPMSAFITDGFSIQPRSPWNSNNLINKNGDDFVSWNWKAASSDSTNTDGTITSTVRANQDAGFSIVKYTGNSTTNQTIGHGLNSSPELIITKCLNDGTKWWGVNTISLTTNSLLRLDSTSAQIADSGNYITMGNTSTFTVQDGSIINGSLNYIAYCFHSVDGHSRIGSYVGTGASGNVQYVGFEPAFVMVKATSTSEPWFILDNKRDPNNPRDNRLMPDSSAAESDGSVHTMDFNSNNFTLNGTVGNGTNGSGQTYIFLAIA